MRAHILQLKYINQLIIQLLGSSSSEQDEAVVLRSKSRESIFAAVVVGFLLSYISPHCDHACLQGVKAKPSPKETHNTAVVFSSRGGGVMSLRVPTSLRLWTICVSRDMTSGTRRDAQGRSSKKGAKMISTTH